MLIEMRMESNFEELAKSKGIPLKCFTDSIEFITNEGKLVDIDLDNTVISIDKNIMTMNYKDFTNNNIENLTEIRTITLYIPESRYIDLDFMRKLKFNPLEIKLIVRNKTNEYKTAETEFLIY